MKKLRKKTTDLLNHNTKIIVKGAKSLWNPYFERAGKVWIPAVTAVLYPFIEF
ncbi:MAG: hypothetical protein JKX73_06930 [Flavobacteriales bacterium]|nr:hypothetical protein [Flavobacteriales bacterium]